MVVNTITCRGHTLSSNKKPFHFMLYFTVPEPSFFTEKETDNLSYKALS